jgi:hypothetical protein
MVWNLFAARKTMGSTDLQDPRGLYDRGLSLPLSKFGGLFPVRVHAGKSLPVLVKHSHLPVLVLSPPIFPELRAFPCGFGFGHGLNISIAIRTRKYQFGQYFARNHIILHYRAGCNSERQDTRNSIPGRPEIHQARSKMLQSTCLFVPQDSERSVKEL